ncbi:hypothetical protein YC2023_029560 [Brassica napus]
MAPRADHSLPKPWERLVDESGYYFYWNPETDETQYERPTCPPPRNFAQVQGAWRVQDPKMAQLCGQAKELMSQFTSFHIQHVGRELNSEADAQANHAINLAENETEEIAGGFRRRIY